MSAASAWEIAIKTRLNKLESIPGAADRFAELIAADGFIHLPISHSHALRAGAHPSKHKDPFDRMLTAQAELEGVPLITTDAVFSDFGTQVLWQATRAAWSPPVGELHRATVIWTQVTLAA